MRRKAATWTIVLGAVPVLALCLLFGASGFGMPDLATEAGRAIFDLRQQRLLAGFLVGASLSCTGVVFQGLLRNPLAEPYVLGVSSGGGLGAAVAILSGFAAATVYGIPVCAFAGAALTLGAVYLLAGGGRGAPSLYGLILSGVIISSLASSLLMFMVSLAPMEDLHSVMWWMLGNLEVSSPFLLRACAVPMLLGFALLWALSPELNALTLGDEMAHYLGVRTRLAMTLGLLAATLVTAAAVAMSGLIGFVGLVVPHAVRHLVGPEHRRLLPTAAIAGGVFLAVCDALARTLLAPREIPVGVITAFVGGPFFLVILHRRRIAEWFA